MAAFVITLSAVTSTGNLTQIYFPGATAGDGTGVSGTQKRFPAGGLLFEAEVQADGTNGGVIELWDIDGNDGGADVDTATVITNAQMVVAAALSPPKARLIYSQSFAGSGTARLAINKGTRFNWGLAARFVAGAGTCNVNFDVEMGFRKIWIAGTT